MDVVETDTILDLEKLRDGFPGLTPIFGQALLEACLVCLEKQQHVSGTILKVYGDWNLDVELRWSTVVNEQMRRTWGNRNETTELAAVCIVTLLVDCLTDYTVLDRADTNTGIDYWLMSKSTPAIEKANGRLEISGIFTGTKTQIEKRLQLKLIQSKQSVSTSLPVIIGIAEFSQPQTRLEVK